MCFIKILLKYVTLKIISLYIKLLIWTVKGGVQSDCDVPRQYYKKHLGT